MTKQEIKLENKAICVRCGKDSMITLQDKSLCSECFEQLKNIDETSIEESNQFWGV